MNPKTAKLLALVGTGLLALGSLLPWVSVTAFFGTINVAGTVGDGKLTLGAAGIVALLLLTGAQLTTRLGSVLSFLFALLGAAICVYDLANISNSVSSVSEDSSGMAVAQIGIGLEIATAGAALAVVALAFQLKRRPVPGSPLPPPVVPAASVTQ